MELVPIQINPLMDLLQRQPIHQPGYEIGASVLEPLVPFMLEPGYAPYWICRPDETFLPLQPRAVFEDSIILPAGSWLIGYTFASQQTVGFKFRIYDTGSKAWLFNRDGSAVACAGGGNAAQRQPYQLDHPMAILGTLNLVITNLSTATNDLQLLLACAVPIDPAADLRGPGEGVL